MNQCNIVEQHLENAHTEKCHYRQTDRLGFLRFVFNLLSHRTLCVNNYNCDNYVYPLEKRMILKL